MPTATDSSTTPPPSPRLEVARLARSLLRSAVDPDRRRRDQLRLACLYRDERDCRASIVEALMPLARAAARSVRTGSEPREDIEQIAALGLIGALDRFDPERGRSFAAFAVPTIRGEVHRHLRDTAWAVHVPRGTKQLALRVRSAEAHGSPLSDAAVAETLGVTLEAITAARLALAGRHADELLGGPKAASRHAETTRIEQIEHRVDIGRMGRDLPYDERAVLALGTFVGLPQTEIARRLGVSQMQVSRLRARALAAMRDRSGERAPALERQT